MTLREGKVYDILLGKKGRNWYISVNESRSDPKYQEVSPPCMCQNICINEKKLDFSFGFDFTSLEEHLFMSRVCAAFKDPFFNTVCFPSNF